MKIIKPLLLSIIILLTFNVGFSQNRPEAEFIKMTKEYNLNADGSYEMRCFKQLKLLTHISFNDLYGETFIVYNPNYHHIKINSCYTIQADGNRVDAPMNAFNEVLPRFAADAPYYNHLREMVVTHTGLEIGATIYLDYTLYTNAGYTDGLIFNDVLQELSPITEYTVSVEYPSATAAFYNQYNLPKPTKNESGGMTKLVWSTKKIPARSQEILQPADGRESPRIAFSTIPASEIISKLAAQFTSAGDKVQNKVKTLIEGKTTNQQKIKSITDYVVNNISFVNIPLDYTGNQLRPVDEVYRTVYGTAAEKAALLTAMINAAGITATPVITTPDWINNTDDINQLLLFVSSNDFVVLAENAYWSPIRSQAFIWNDTGKSLYTLENNPKKLSPLMKSANIEFNYEITADKQDGKIVFKVAHTGNLYTNTTTNSNIGNVSEKETEAKALQASENNGYYTITLPMNNNGVESWRIKTLNSSPRSTLLQVPFAINETYNYNITLANNIELVNKKVDMNITNTVGEVIIRIIPNGNTVNVLRSIKINNDIVNPKDYRGFKELMDAWNTQNYRVIIVK